MMAQYFSTNYVTASGVGAAGVSLGMIFFAPLTQLLLDTYGWRGAMLILGGINLHLGVCGLLLGPPSSAKTEDKYQQLSSVEEPLGCDEPGAHAEKKSLIGSFKDVLLSLKKYFRFALWFRLSFWNALLFFVCPYTASGLWLIYFVSFAKTKGFSAYNAVTFTTFGGIGNLVFKIVLAFIVDRGFIKLRQALLVATVFCALALSILPWMNSFWLMMGNACIFHGFNGVLISLSDFYTRDLLGVEDLVCAFSWMELVAGIAEFTLGFCPGIA